MARICQLAHVEVTYNFVTTLVDALRADGHEVVAACNMDADGRYARQYLGPGVPIHRIRGARSLTWRTLTTEVAALARYFRREQFDAVHVHGPLLAIQARLAAKIARVPVVIYHAHGFPFHDAMRRSAYRVAYGVERLFARHLTDVIITVNAEDAETARRGRFRPEPGQIVETPGVGVDIGRFRPASAATPGDDVDRKTCRDELGVPSDALAFVFVGRLVGYKGVRELATAFCSIAAEHPDLWLVVVGQTLGSERDHSIGPFLRGMQREPGGERIILAGRREDMPRVLRSADGFILPSYREGLPVSLMEAMSTELPCITTDVRGSREAVIDNATGLLVPPRDPDALADAISRLASDPELRQRLGTAARQHIAATYTVGASCEPQLALYRRVLRSPSKPDQSPDSWERPATHHHNPGEK